MRFTHIPVYIVIFIFAHVACGQNAISAYKQSFNKRIPFAKTVSAARNAIRLSELEKLDTLLCLSNIQTGILYWNDGLFDSARFYLLQGEHLAARLNRSEDEARSIHYLGLVEYYVCNFAKALQFYSDAESRYQTLKSDSAVAKVKSHKGMIYSAQGNFAAAIQNMIEAYKLQENFPAYRDMTLPMRFTDVAAEQVFYRSKLEKDLESLQFLEGRNDTSKLALTYTNIGLDYTYLKDYHNAIPYLIRSADLMRKRGELPFTGDLAAAYAGIGMFDSAVYWCTQRLHDVSTRGTKIHKAAALTQMASLYLKMSQLNLARQYYQEAFEMYCRLTLRRSISGCYKQFALIDEMQGRFSHALENIEQSLLISDSIGCAKDHADAMIIKARLLKHANRPAEALAAYEQGKRVYDSIASGENQLNVSRIQLDYELDKKNRSLETLTIQNEIKDARVRTRTLQIQLAIALIILIAATATFNFIRFRHKKKNADLLKRQNNVIEQQNKTLTSQNEEKAVLLAEVHHRVKNNLQVISSLINLQAGQGSPETKEILNQLNGRIFSMGLLHEKMYRAENMSSIRLDLYLQELINFLLASFQNLDQPITVSTAFDEVAIDADRALTCGLIYNELFTNSLKHAFAKSQSDRKIIVSLTNPETGITLRISDNGRNESKQADAIQKSFGLRFVDQLVTVKLKGHWYFTTNGGFSNTIVFDS